MPNVVLTLRNADMAPQVTDGGLLRAVESIEHFLRGTARDALVSPSR